jgi:hypothetical protein
MASDLPAQSEATEKESRIWICGYSPQKNAARMEIEVLEVVFVFFIDTNAIAGPRNGCGLLKANPPIDIASQAPSVISAHFSLLSGHSAPLGGPI